MQGTACASAYARYNCRQKQYHGMRNAVQFVFPLLRKVLSFARTPPREQLLSMLVGAPYSLAHEGPLTCTHLHAFVNTPEGELLRMFEGCIAERLAAPPSQHVMKMWSPDLQEYYKRATAKACVDASGERKPQRFEAGLSACSVFSLGVQNHTVESDLWGECGSGHTHQGTYLNSFGDQAAREGEEDIASDWCRLIDMYSLFLPDRSPLHELENLPQEIGIGELLLSLLKHVYMTDIDIKTIVDVGGGNGFLAAQLAERLGCESFVVDPFTPKHAIDNANFPHWTVGARVRQRRERRYPLHRISKRLQDVDWGNTHIDFDSCAVVAKHLCGTSVDSCLRHLMASNKLPRVLVVVPCCFNKGRYAEYCNPGFLSHVADVEGELSWEQCTRLTDWNKSCYQQAGNPLSCSSCCSCCDGGYDRRAGEKKVSRKKKMEHFLPCMDDIATLVEVIINYGRVLWLREMGYQTSVVEYVPRCVTPKNRAIVAVRRERSSDASLEITMSDTHPSLPAFQ